jgi:hypothetical protein
MLSAMPLLALALLLAFPAWAADGHREAVLRLVGAAAIVADDARKGAGTLAIANGPRMSQRACREFFQDLVSLSRLEVLPSTQEPGDVAVRWRGRQEMRIVARSGGVHTVLARGSGSWPLCSGRRAENAEAANDTDLRDSAAKVFPLDLRNAPSAVPLSAPGQ